MSYTENIINFGLSHYLDAGKHNAERMLLNLFIVMKISKIILFKIKYRMVVIMVIILNHLLIIVMIQIWWYGYIYQDKSIWVIPNMMKNV